MSLTNEWANGEDSIANPRSHRCSPNHNVNPKDQLHSGSRRVRQKGCRGCYGDSDTADMVAVGYINNDHDNNHDGPRQGNTYYGSSSRGAGRDSRPKTEWRQRHDRPPPLIEELLNGGCTRHTYLDKDGRQKLAHLITTHTYLNSASGKDMNKTARRRCRTLQRTTAATQPATKCNATWPPGRHDLAPHRTSIAGHCGRSILATTWFCAYDTERVPDKPHPEEARKGSFSCRTCTTSIS
jgi:hypothetical protein